MARSGAASAATQRWRVCVTALKPHTSAVAGGNRDGSQPATEFYDRCLPIRGAIAHMAYACGRGGIAS